MKIPSIFYFKVSLNYRRILSGLFFTALFVCIWPGSMLSVGILVKGGKLCFRNRELDVFAFSPGPRRLHRLDRHQPRLGGRGGNLHHHRATCAGGEGIPGHAGGQGYEPPLPSLRIPL